MTKESASLIGLEIGEISRAWLTKTNGRNMMTGIGIEKGEPSGVLEQALSKLLPLINHPLATLFWCPLAEFWRAASTLGWWSGRHLDAVDQWRKLGVEIVLTRNGPEHRIFDDAGMNLPVTDQVAIGIVGIRHILQVQEFLVEIMINLCQDTAEGNRIRGAGPMDGQKSATGAMEALRQRIITLNAEAWVHSQIMWV